MDPKVSIILLTYNQVKYIEQAVNSVINQTYKNWELIVSDNGSDDGTKEILKSYAYDKRIKLLLYDSNDYVTKRSNQVISEASGEFISFLYGDDFYLPKKIEEQVKLLNQISSRWGVVYGPGYILNEFTSNKSEELSLDAHGEIIKDILDNYYVKGYLNPISPLVRRECFQKYPFYEDLFTEGESIYMRISLTYKFYYLDKPLVVMRKHDQNVRWYSKKNLEIQDECLKRLGDYKELPENCLNSLIKLRAKNYSMGVWENVRLSEKLDVNYVRGRFFKAVKLNPRELFSPKNITSIFLTFLPNIIRKAFNYVIDSITGKERNIYLDGKFIKK